MSRQIFTFPLKQMKPDGSGPVEDGTCKNTPPSSPLDAISVNGNVVTAKIKKPGQGIPYCFKLGATGGEEGCWEPFNSTTLCASGNSWHVLTSEPANRTCPSMPVIAGTPWKGDYSASVTLEDGVVLLSQEMTADPLGATLGVSIKCETTFSYDDSYMLLYVDSIDDSGLQPSDPPHPAGDSIYAWIDYVGGSFEILYFAVAGINNQQSYMRNIGVHLGENIIKLNGIPEQIEFGIALRDESSYGSLGIGYICFTDVP